MARPVTLREWSIAAGIGFLIAGAMLWYARDPVETYHANAPLAQYAALPGDAPLERFSYRAGSVQMPWWRIELQPGDELIVSSSVPDSLAGERGFMEFIGREVGAKTAGSIAVGGASAALRPSPYPRWQRVYLAAPLISGQVELRLHYQSAAVGARLEVWGQYVGAYPQWPYTPKLYRNGREMGFGEARVVGFRGGFYKDTARSRYILSLLQQYPARDLMWRLGRARGGVSFDNVGLVVMLIGALACALGLLPCVWRFVRARRGEAAALAVILSATAWLRWDALGRAIEGLTRHVSGGVGAISNGLLMDSASYMRLAMDIYSNTTPANYDWPVGFPLLAALTFSVTGIDPHPVQLVHVALQTFAGLSLFVLAYRLSGGRRSALLAPLAWMLLSRAVPFTYQFLTETAAIFMLTTATAVLIRPSGDTPRCTIVVSGTLLLAVGAYFRDVLVVLLPPMLLLILLRNGPGMRQRVLACAVALVVIAAVWTPSAFYHANKGQDATAFDWMPVISAHLQLAKSTAAEQHGGDSSLSFLGRALEIYTARINQDPAGFVKHIIKQFYEFWGPTWGDEVRRPMAESPFVWYYDPLYALLWACFVVLGVPAMLRSPEVRLIAIYLFYVTLFHVLFFPAFSSRPKAPFLPMVVLLGYLSVLYGSAMLKHARVRHRNTPVD